MGSGCSSARIACYLPLPPAAPLRLVSGALAKAVAPLPPPPPGNGLRHAAERPSQGQVRGSPGDPNRGLSLQYLAGPKPEDPEVPPPESGPTLESGSSTLVADLRRGSESSEDLLELTIIDVEERIRGLGAPPRLCPRDDQPGAAYVDVAEDPRAGFATHMLSYTWGYKLGDIVSALRGFARSHFLLESQMRVWICCFCINQWRVQGGVVPFEEFRDTFHQRITTIKQVLALLAPWDDPKSLKRVWCVFELHEAITTDPAEGVELHIITPEDQSVFLGDSGSAAGDNYMDNMARISSAFGRIRVQDAEARYPADRLNILRIVAPGVNLCEDPKQRITEQEKVALAKACEAHNAVIQGQLKQWIVDASHERLRKKWAADPLCQTLDDGSYSESCSVAWMLINLGRHEEALKTLEEALKRTRPDTHGYGAVLFQMGQCCRKQWQSEETEDHYRRAEDHYRRAQDCLQRCGSQNTNDFASNLAGYAILLNSKPGRHQEALALFDQALECYRSSGADRTLDYANVVKHRGICYLSLEDYTKAEEAFHESSGLFCALKACDNPWYFDLLSRKAMLELMQIKSAFESHAALDSPQYKLLCEQVEKYARDLRASLNQ